MYRSTVRSGRAPRLLAGGTPAVRITTRALDHTVRASPPRRSLRRFALGALAVVLAAASSSCIGGAAGAPTEMQAPPAGVPAVLFIGNSLTYWNDMPGMVRALFDSAGPERYTIETVGVPDASLEDQWALGTAVRAVDAGGWRVVVLQQGPSSLPDSRVLLREWTRRFADRITSRGGRPALYMVWPSVSRAGDFDRVVESYTLAAQDVGGMLFPVGEAWRAAWRRDPNLALYSPDGLHPSAEGSYLAAIVIHAVLSGRSPVGLPTTLRLENGGRVQINPAVAAILQAAAAEANERFARR
jgi:hypothetical protein